MTDVVNKVTTVYVADTQGAIRDTQKLADAQTKGAKQAAKAMDDFQRDATAALGKVEKSVQAQEKAWTKAQRAIADSGGVWDKVEGGIKSFNSTVGVLAMGLGAIPKAVETVSLAVGLLGKAWGALGDVFGSKPQLRMMWEESPHKRWIEMFEEKTRAQRAWAESLQVEWFGADVDSDKSMARRLEYRRQLKERAGNVDFLSQAKLEEQKAAVQAQYDASAARAAANREREREAAARRGSGGRDLPDFSTGWGATLGRARDWVGTGLADQAEIERLKMLAVDVLDTLREGAGVVGDIAGPRYEAEGTEIGRRTGGQGWNRLNDKAQPTILDRMFGNVDEIDGYTRAWSTLEDAVTSGYAALITGSESAGAAVKKVIASSIMAEGSRMLVLALRESAMAIAALAGGNFVSAATHGKAALMFGAGATAAGIAASALGGGGSVGGTNPSTLPTGAATARDREEGTRTHIIIGQGWQDEDTPRQRGHRFAKSAANSAGYDTTPRGVAYQ